MISVSGADEVARDLADMAAKAYVGAIDAVRDSGFDLEARVKAHASGRPGPNAITGDYRRSIQSRLIPGAGEITASVGTDRPQGRRLEFGFVGVDSIGRHYAQRPFAHFRPAADEMDENFHGRLHRMVEAL